MKVLIVEDDLDLLDLTGYALRREGFTVFFARDGREALERWESENPDLVLLDIRLPQIDGFEVCRRIRQESETPVIMLTGRDDEEDVLRGLGSGADDYVIKPFSAKQLIARMKALLRRSNANRYQQPVSVLEVGDLTLDLQSHEVSKAGKPIEFTPLEFRILYMLAMNEGRVIPYSRLVEYVWGYDANEPGLLKTHVCHIRKKLDLPSGKKGGIRAVLGVGYCFGR
jgi:DNA-binding response OmpR family regulator